MRGPTATTRRAGVAAVAAAAVAALATVLLPARADAHAELISTEPAPGEQLAAAPEAVVLHFSEAIDLGDDTIEVLDADGERLDVGRPQHPDGDTAAAAVTLPDLDDGAYVVAWRVVSSDSHPIGGAFTFRVGDAAGAPADDQQLIDDVLGGERGGDRALGVVFGVVRFVAFAGITVLVGAALFVAWLWPAGGSDPRARRLLGGAWLATVVATVASIPLQGAYAEGGTLADALSAGVIADELGARTGRAWVVRLVLLAGAAVVLPRLWPGPAVAGSGGIDRPPGEGAALDGPAGDGPGAGGPEGAGSRALPPGGAAARAVTVVGGLALLVTVSLTGHAVSGDLVPLAFVTDAVHLGAVSAWVGGLALLALVVLRPGVDDVERVVGRFSPVALGAVVAIAATGVVQGWRQLGSYDALGTTAYGRLLLVKVALVGAMLGAAAVSRSWVRQRARARAAALALSPGPGAVAAAPGTSRLSVLRQSVAAEAGLAVAVLAVTALLVNAVPGESAAPAGAGRFVTEVTEDDLVLRIEVDPAATGPVALHLTLTGTDGAAVPVEEMRADLALPERDLGPLTVSLTELGPGHYTADGAEIPFAGDWDLEVVARTSDIDQTRFDTVVTVT